MKLPRITEQDVRFKKVLVRVDFNVPLKGGKVVDDTRIRAAVPTIKWLVENGAAVFLCSHLGKPKGKKDRKLSLKPVAAVLKKELGQKVNFVPEAIGSKKEKAVASSKEGDVFLLENTRFYPGEEANSEEFARDLAADLELFVFDAFSAAHRAHASVTGVAEYLPVFAGESFAAEYEALSELTAKPKSPLVAVIGGAKISTKIDVLKSLVKKVDVLILGGGMANNMLVAEGYDIGNSLYEEEFVDTAEDIGRATYENAVELLLPDDVLVAKKVGGRTITKAVDEVNKGEMIVDIGPKSIAKFAEPLKFAGTIFWNGPMGIVEHPNSAKGTEAVAKIIAESAAKSIIGGGDTIASLGSGVEFDYVALGGGATLEFLAGKKLPGLAMFEK